MVDENFGCLKGIVEALLEEMGINNYQISPYQLQKTFYGKIFHSHRRAEVTLGKNSLGIFGEIKKILLLKLGIKQRIFIFDLDFKELASQATNDKKYTPIAKYPPIIEDLSFIVSPKTYVGDIIQTIKSVNLIIQSVELIDTYEQTRTFRITYQDPRKTLTDKEVEKIRKEIIKKVEDKFRAKIKKAI